jgi:hypothetical protein
MSIDQPQPTPDAVVPAEPASGVTTYFGVLFSPNEAFETLARVPMWGWACIFGMLITIVASIVGLPATIHIAQVAQQAQIAQSPADQQQAMRDAIGKTAGLLQYFIIIGSLVVPWIAWIIAALVVLAGAALGRGVAIFGAAWALAVNSYAISALGALVANVILRLQGAENITRASDAYVLPSLAMLVHGDAKTGAMLYAFNVVNLWYYAILALGMQRMMKMSAMASWVTVIIFSVLLALLGMAFAK